MHPTVRLFDSRLFSSGRVACFSKEETTQTHLGKELERRNPRRPGNKRERRRQPWKRHVLSSKRTVHRFASLSGRNVDVFCFSSFFSHARDAVQRPHMRDGQRSRDLEERSKRVSWTEGRDDKTPSKEKPPTTLRIRRFCFPRPPSASARPKALSLIELLLAQPRHGLS